jgi:hypothetical protein
VIRFALSVLILIALVSVAEAGPIRKRQASPCSSARVQAPAPAVAAPVSACKASTHVRFLHRTRLSRGGCGR